MGWRAQRGCAVEQATRGPKVRMNIGKLGPVNRGLLDAIVTQKRPPIAIMVGGPREEEEEVLV